MSKIRFAAAMMVGLISIAVAQDGRLPQASLDREVNLQVQAQTAVPGHPPRTNQTPPSYCKPCLFYAGDFDSSASDANGLANEVDIVVSTGATTYAPFIVPKGKTWTVTGLFTNNFMSGEVVDPRMAPYEIRKGIPKSGGSGGQLVCHGRKPATLVTLAACQDFGFGCYATIVNTIKGCRLRSGKYWVSVVPHCTNPHDPACENSYRAFVTNDDGAMKNRFGPLEPANDSFFNSIYFGAVWEPSSEQQTSSRFSVGVEGTSTER
jgi:hypothetical protein